MERRCSRPVATVTSLETEGLANPVLVNEAVLYDFVFSPNQAKIVTNSAKAFAAQVTEAGIDTDYALLAEIMMLPNGTPGGIHYYLSDPKGELADGSFTNDHWDEFKAVQPKTPDDGCEVAIRMLRRTWGNEHARAPRRGVGQHASRGSGPGDTVRDRWPRAWSP